MKKSYFFAFLLLFCFTINFLPIREPALAAAPATLHIGYMNNPGFLEKTSEDKMTC